jgi:hypothetical protein
MITASTSKIHWTYFTALEQDVETLARYVEPVTANFDTYSLEICRILFSACAECEVVLKMLAARNGTNTERYNIENLRADITTQFPDFVNEKVYLRRYGLELDPWTNWRSGTSPDWWTAYNKVKHHRALNYPHGNIKNSLNAVAGLMLAVVFHYRHEAPPPNPPIAYRDFFNALAPESRLFFLSDDKYPSLLRVA